MNFGGDVDYAGPNIVAIRSGMIHPPDENFFIRLLTAACFLSFNFKLLVISFRSFPSNF